MRSHRLLITLCVLSISVILLYYTKALSTSSLSVRTSCNNCNERRPKDDLLQSNEIRGESESQYEYNNISDVCHRLWKKNTAPPVLENQEINQETCLCSQNGYTEIDNASQQRRIREFRAWKREHDARKDLLLYSPPVSPFGFVAGGLSVQPLKSVAIKPLHIDPLAVHCLAFIEGFSFDDGAVKMTFTSAKQFGVLFVSVSPNPPHIIIRGNNTVDLVISIPLQTLKTQIQETRISALTKTSNNVLQNIYYRNTFYDIFTRDVIHVKFLQYTMDINVVIKEVTLPRLYDPKPGNDIANKVTIVTKTFERPDSVRNLIKSTRKYYPNITIVIADDSREPISFQGNNIKHYIMPFAEGWFAGRNLAISQVRTKYFLWVDDDFEFTKSTDLNKCVERLEDSDENLDIVGGVVVSGWFGLFQRHFVQIIEVSDGGETGTRLCRKSGVYRKLYNYPQCSITSIVVNFFMAKTMSVRSIGFDPELERIGHSEFFFDGFGYLRIASCSDFSIKHSQTKPKEYMKYRNRKVDPLIYSIIFSKTIYNAIIKKRI